MRVATLQVIELRRMKNWTIVDIRCRFPPAVFCSLVFFRGRRTVLFRLHVGFLLPLFLPFIFLFLDEAFRHSFELDPLWSTTSPNGNDYSIEYAIRSIVDDPPRMASFFWVRFIVR